MPSHHVRSSAVLEAVHTTDPDYKDVVRGWIGDGPEADQFLAELDQKTPKPWVVREPASGGIGIVHPADFAGGFEDVNVTNVLDEIWAERQTHPSRGYTVAHDDAEGSNHLVFEAQRQILLTIPVADDGYHPTDDERRKRLVKAGSLIVAAIDKIDRAQDVRTFSTD